ncbi:hypothetical protein [Halorientalis sp.]|uniref:hypothetical protein n=1 Tax=Halorientalis sp. TaxID=1931229 RepID=UPI00261E8922|nr:hypothetical protein [Halorientalis sp.]
MFFFELWESVCEIVQFLELLTELSFLGFEPPDLRVDLVSIDWAHDDVSEVVLPGDGLARFVRFQQERKEVSDSRVLEIRVDSELTVFPARVSVRVISPLPTSISTYPPSASLLSDTPVLPQAATSACRNDVVLVAFRLTSVFIPAESSIDVPSIPPILSAVTLIPSEMTRSMLSEIETHILIKDSGLASESILQ